MRLALRVVMLCAVALAVCSLSRVANAAEKVPMCGELGQSIDAPPPVYPGRGDVLAASPCEMQRRAVSFSDVPPLPRDLPPAPSADLKIALSAPQLLPRVPSKRLGVVPPCQQERRPGFVRELERPPR